MITFASSATLTLALSSIAIHTLMDALVWPHTETMLSLLKLRITSPCNLETPLFSMGGSCDGTCLPLTTSMIIMAKSGGTTQTRHMFSVGLLMWTALVYHYVPAPSSVAAALALFKWKSKPTTRNATLTSRQILQSRCAVVLMRGMLFILATYPVLTEGATELVGRRRSKSCSCPKFGKRLRPALLGGGKPLQDVNSWPSTERSSTAKARN